MNIVNGDESYPATPNNSFFFQTENDLLDGFYIDLDETYIFITKHSPQYRLLEEPGHREGIAVIYKDEFDHTEEPFLYIISAIGRVLVGNAEYILEHPDEVPEFEPKEELPELRDLPNGYHRFMELSEIFRESGLMRQLEIMKEIDEVLDERN